jgi:hypothetical protein
MSETVTKQVGDTVPDFPLDFDASIVSLRAAGGDQFDPVRLRYLEVLAKRTMAQEGIAKPLLEAKLMQALTEFRIRLEEAQAVAHETIVTITQQHPAAVEGLQRSVESGDLKGVRRSIEALNSNQPQPSLSGLVRQLAQSSSENNVGDFEGNFSSHQESTQKLKILRNFDNTWSSLSADKQVEKALAQAPKNAGPINSHMLVVRSLALMRDISPAYLNRFLSYADTLLCLDQSEQEKHFNIKKPVPAKKVKK